MVDGFSDYLVGLINEALDADFVDASPNSVFENSGYFGFFTWQNKDFLIYECANKITMELCVRYATRRRIFGREEFTEEVLANHDEMLELVAKLCENLKIHEEKNGQAGPGLP